MSPRLRRDPLPNNEPTRRDRLPVIAVLLATLGVAIVAVGLVANRGGVDHNPSTGTHEIDVRIATPTPTDASERDSRARFPPYNEGAGPCHDPKFHLEAAPEPSRVFHSTDALSVTVTYDAPGCAMMTAYFGVRHTIGSPRYDYYCTARTATAGLGVCKHGFDGNVPAVDVPLTAPRGTVTLIASPGTFPPDDLASVPDIEGAVLCAIVLGANDGVPGGSHSFQQLDLGCP